MDLKQYLEEKKSMVDEYLSALVPDNSVYPGVIHDSMHYSVFAGGKRLRPILCLAAAEAVGKDAQTVLPVACALELIHTYSLIHDDLPAMDDDDFRRGRPTNHRVYGEGIAILSGDALLTLAFETMASYGISFGCHAVILQVIKEIAAAAGSRGMIGGQTVDLDSEGKNIDAATLEYIHTHKTGALFTVALRAGALLHNAPQRELEALTCYARHFGLAFQITDDLLDITGDMVKLGKPTGSDLKNSKATYPSLFGEKKAQELAQASVRKAIACLEGLPGKVDPLVGLAYYLLDRDS